MPKNKQEDASADPAVTKPMQADTEPKDASSPPAETGQNSSSGDADTQLVNFPDDNANLSDVLKGIRKKASGSAILVPVDFSDPSEAALVFAGKLAERTSAPLIILHVVHDPGEMPGYYSKLVKKKRFDRIQDIARDVFEAFIKKVMSEYPDLKSVRKAQALLVIGLPVTRILEITEKVNPFMVVMGSQGRTGLKHLFLGSKAEQVVHLCPAPVTIVKNKK